MLHAHVHPLCFINIVNASLTPPGRGALTLEGSMCRPQDPFFSGYIFAPETHRLKLVSSSRAPIFHFQDFLNPIFSDFG